MTIAQVLQCKKSKSSNQIQYKHTVNYTQIMWMSNVNSKRICLNWAISVVSGFTGVYCMWMIDMTGWYAAVSRNPSVHVPLLCLLHYIRLVFHAKSLHWRHHWKLQHAEKEGIFLYNVLAFISCRGWLLQLSAYWSHWRPALSIAVIAECYWWACHWYCVMPILK